MFFFRASANSVLLPNTYCSFWFPVTLGCGYVNHGTGISHQAFALVTTPQPSCSGGMRASRCWSIQMRLLLYTHAAQNWRKTINLEESLSNSETSTTTLSMWLQQITYEPATRTVPRFNNAQCVWAVYRMENRETGNCSCTSYGSGFIVLWCSLPDLWHLGFWSNGIFIFVPQWSFDRCIISITEELGTESYWRYFRYKNFLKDNNR